MEDVLVWLIIYKCNCALINGKDLRNTIIDRHLECLTRRFRKRFQEFLSKYVESCLSFDESGKRDTLTLNVGCANNFWGEIRLDIEKTPAANILADARCLPFRSSAFDVVGALSVLHHIKEYEKSLSEIVRVTKPGGKIIGWEPIVFHPYLINITYIFRLTNERGINPIKIKNFLLKYGVSIVKEYYLLGLRPILLFFPAYIEKFIKFDRFLPKLLRGYYFYVAIKQR